MSGVVSGYTNAINGQNSANAAAEAGGRQMAWGERGIESLRGQQDTNANNFAPYTGAGAKAEGMLASGMGPNGSLGRSFTQADFHQDPGYQYNLDAAMKAIGNSNAGRGGSLSGGTAKALVDYGQHSADNSYNSAYNRFTSAQDRNFSQLSHVAGQGLSATQGLGSLNTSLGHDIGSAYQNQGAINAQQIMGQAAGQNQVTSGMGSMLSGGIAMGS